MTSAMIYMWRNQPDGISDASGLIRVLCSPRYSPEEKILVIDNFNDWEVLICVWFEVADALPSIESLFENEQFPAREKAALLASKLCYCLEEYDKALDFALSADETFRLSSAGPLADGNGDKDEEYVNKMVQVALDGYKVLCAAGQKDLHPRLNKLVDRIFDRHMKMGQYNYVIALGLETLRLEKIADAIKASPDPNALLQATMTMVIEGPYGQVFRNQVVSLLVQLMCSNREEIDYMGIIHGYIRLNRSNEVADIFNCFFENPKPNDELLLFQFAFDLYENASQTFNMAILDALMLKEKAAQEAAKAKKLKAGTGVKTEPEELKEQGASEMEQETVTPAVKREVEQSVSDEATNAKPIVFDLDKVKKEEESDSESEGMGRDRWNSESISKVERILSLWEADSLYGKVRSILRGDETVRHHMHFLIKNNHTDMLILKEMKDSVRTATAHNATLLANGLMHLGTTCDDFLRENLDWISKATNWNKFNAVASLGLIHRGHEETSLKLLEPYLPKSEQEGFGFKEGGALFAYGLIHVNRVVPSVLQYLGEQLSNAQLSPIRHGACLGLGVAAMETSDNETFATLRDALFLDDAVTGEAAGLAMGMVMAGTMNEHYFRDMRQYLEDTQHDKIQRGLRTGIPFLALGTGDGCEEYVSELLDAKSNPVLRATGANMLATAYVGTGDPSVAARLLEKVATDPNNEVKRYAAMALGYVLSNDPETCLSYVGMLIEHFNPYVRYGAAMALGIACAGSGYKEAISLLEPLLSAKENFVRQGAVIALAFILIQQNEASCPNVTSFRKQITKMVSEKGEDSLAKFGAIIAQGIIDAGGRNVTVSLHHRNGQVDRAAVIGMMCFQQYWYWHTMTAFITLAMRPTAVIALNKDLMMPKLLFKTNAKQALYTYPPAIEPKKKEEGERVETAVLSITNKKKQQRRLRGSLFEMKSDLFDFDSFGDSSSSSKKEDEKKPAPVLDQVPSLQNPARVVRSQLKSLSLQDNARHAPIKPMSYGGIIVMVDLNPMEFEELVPQIQSAAEEATDNKQVVDREPHAPFELDHDDY